MLPDLLIERFNERLIKKGPDDCWPMNNCKDNRGYYILKINNKCYKAHRISWALANGYMPDPKMLVCHKCDNPGCVNPNHLFLGSHKDNHDDAVRKGRQTTVLSALFCKSGHPLTVDNSYYYKYKNQTKRNCRICRARISREAGEKLWQKNRDIRDLKKLEAILSFGPPNPIGKFCLKGHALYANNLHWKTGASKPAARTCKLCVYLKKRAWHQNKKAKKPASSPVA